MIPKKIIFYWGQDTMSWMRYMTIYSFRKFNPDWEVVLFTSNQSNNSMTWITPNVQDFFSYTGDNYIDRLKDLNITYLNFDLLSTITPSHKSNFLKWLKLSEEGGIYADMDILWTKPIDEFYDTIKDYDTVICQSEYLSIGLLASSGNNSFFRDIFVHGFACFNPQNYQTAGVENIYSLYQCPSYEVLVKAISKYPGMRFYNIPMDLIYGFDSTKVEEAFTNPGRLPDSAIGYHWYAGHPVAQEFNNKLNENTFREYNCLFSNLIKAWNE